MRFLLLSIFTLTFSAGVAFCSQVDSTKISKDTVCLCKPSLPLEIVASSIIWGVPNYWLLSSIFDRDTQYVDVSVAFVPEALLLLMFSLGPVAEWTSGCKASYWHTLWIGFGADVVSVLLYGAAYGYTHHLNPYKFHFAEYLALGVLPSIGAALIYNLFLHCPEKKASSETKDQGIFIFPSVGGKNTAALNFVMPF